MSKTAIQGHVFWGQWKGDKGQNKKLSYRLETGRQHSAMHFFVAKPLCIAVITYNASNHLSLRPVIS